MVIDQLLMAVLRDLFVCTLILSSIYYYWASIVNYIACFLP